MTLFVVKWLLGGLLIASIPIIAQYYSPKVAGMLLLIPVITIASVIFVNHELGKEALVPMIKFSLISIVPLLLFLSTLYLSLHYTTTITALGLASVVWVGVAFAFMHFIA